MTLGVERRTRRLQIWHNQEIMVKIWFTKRRIDERPLMISAKVRSRMRRPKPGLPKILTVALWKQSEFELAHLLQ